MKRDKVPMHRYQPVFRRAGLLDVPYLFELILEGSESGFFSDSFQGGIGAVRLTRMLLGVLVSPAWHIIIGPQQDAIGFFKLASPSAGAGGSERVLELMAIAPAYRNQGIGSAVIERLIAELPAQGRLVAHCTKYARAMQHILKKETFRRSRNVVAPHMERYVLVKP